jgi:hypothetical protein
VPIYWALLLGWARLQWTAWQAGLGRIVVSEIEAPNMLATLV